METDWNRKVWHHFLPYIRKSRIRHLQGKPCPPKTAFAGHLDKRTKGWKGTKTEDKKTKNKRTKGQTDKKVKSQKDMQTNNRKRDK
jgi:hypothetical protein